MTGTTTEDPDHPPRDAAEAYAEARRTVEDPARLAAVHATGLLDSDVEEAFDRLTRLAVRLVRVPAAFVSLVDEHRDFYKSACGFGEPLASARELTGPTFCHYAIRSREPLVIPDTAADPVYREVPTVRSLGVAAYVGVPLVVGGAVVGSFCAIDVRPRAWTAEDLEVLTELAASSQREIELRGALRESQRAAARIAEQAATLDVANQQMQEQAVELEVQHEELLATAAHLEEQVAAVGQARAAAEAANAAKGQFLANMSHELRTPLNAIGGYVQLLGMGIHGPVTPQQRTALERIEGAQRRLLALITDILNFAKLESGTVEFHLAPVDLRALLDEVVPLLGPQVAQKGLALDVRVPDGTWTARADRDKLGQVLVNLLTNATKFTDGRHATTGAQGRITVDVVACADAAAAARGAAGGVRADALCVRVRDTGIGIPADRLESIFEPFVQVRAGYTQGGPGGAGLGLAISRDLARGMGGDLVAESAEGEGSTFTVVVPRD